MYVNLSSRTLANVILLPLLLMLLLTGCGSVTSEPPPTPTLTPASGANTLSALNEQLVAAEARWKARNIQQYKAEIRRSGPAFHILINLTVAPDGTQLSCKTIKGQAELCGQAEEHPERYTVPGLFDELRQQLADLELKHGPQSPLRQSQLIVTYDDSLGYPTHVVDAIIGTQRTDVKLLEAQ